MILFPLVALSADSAASAALELAEKILATTGPLENVQLAFRNRTSWSALEAEARFQAVEKALRARGVRLAGESEATTLVTVTYSENAQDYLWVAEIQRGPGHDLVMVTQGKVENTPATSPAQPMELRSKLLVEQSDPVLDIAHARDNLVVLDPGHVSLFNRQNDRWMLRSAAAIPKIPNLPRDPRGRLRQEGDSIQAFLPGMLCSGSTNPTFAIDCVKSQAPWPLEQGPARLEPGRNSFAVGVIPAFYSEAAAEGEGDNSWVFTGVDGRAVLYDDRLKPVGTIPGWGSDIAGATSSCGARRQILVSLPGDSAESGSIQAFEIVRRQAVAVTPPLRMPGPVTALWSFSSRDGVVAVSRDTRTGRYAAYELSIACSP